MGSIVKIASDWGALMQDEFEKPYFSGLVEFVRSEYASGTVYPPGKEIFRAFDACPVAATKVVIVGQDPYHGPGQAHGLCFSVRKGVPAPPSLINIFKEVVSDTGCQEPADGDLERWSGQGVLLLNAILTVRASSPGSHQNQGWEIFTDEVIRKLAEHKDHLVFMLWGAYAQKKGAFIDRTKHLVLEAPHPSPLSVYRGFSGCKHFSKANEYLKSLNKEIISW
jgi:uracil-DNA glycosylase